MRGFVLPKIWVLLLWALLAPTAHAQVTAGTALRFDGTNGYVSVAHSATFNSYPFTATAWIRTTNTGVAIQGIVSSV